MIERKTYVVHRVQRVHKHLIIPNNNIIEKYEFDNTGEKCRRNFPKIQIKIENSIQVGDKLVEWTGPSLYYNFDYIS